MQVPIVKAQVAENWMNTLGNDDRKARNLQKFLSEKPAPTVRLTTSKKQQAKRPKLSSRVAKAVRKYETLNQSITKRSSSRLGFREFNQSKRCYVPSKKYQEIERTVVVKPLNAKRVRFCLEVPNGERGMEVVKDESRNGKLSKMLGVRERKVETIVHAAHTKSIAARRLTSKKNSAARMPRVQRKANPVVFTCKSGAQAQKLSKLLGMGVNSVNGAVVREGHVRKLCAMLGEEPMRVAKVLTEGEGNQKARASCLGLMFMCLTSSAMEQ